ncbi:MAG TPA: aminoacetone oxidase family FAD-binding enzyme [Gemmatimonadales bacterium]|nr:aminoacetone oxidase family FAD-binding enzyme [Gemmatimonadales bacterium]
MTPVIAVLGAGAAGIMAAVHAAGPGRRVLLLERTADGGRKILISGGGRCNVLPGTLDESRFVTASSPHTLRNILRSWPLAEQRRFFEEDLALPLVLEPDTGKLFPVANKARAVRDTLIAHARERGVECLMNAQVTGLTATGSRWQIALGDAPPITADAVIVATGGLSVPKTGSDGFGLTQLAALGHVVHPTYPALTPILCAPPAFADLAGVSLTVTATAVGTEKAVAHGGFLFTHHGYSGPAVLDVSHVLVRQLGTERPRLEVRWTDLSPSDWERALAAGPQQVATAVRQHLPARLADRLVGEAAVSLDTRLSQLRREDRLRLIATLTRCVLPWTGDEGYRKAEVTGGGVSLGDVDPRTLESRRLPGLFLAGELLDAFGPIGGYNFVWAWTTGRLAGLGAAARITTI